MGIIEVEEQLFLENKALVRPFSKSAEIECRMCSEPLERVIVDFGADDSFEKAHEKIEEHYGVNVPTSTIRKVTQEHAKKMSQVKNKSIEKSQAQYIIGSIDGVMVPIVEMNEEKEDLRKARSVCWKECRLALACKKGSLTPTYDATMGSVDEAGAILKKCVTKVGLGSKTYVHIVADGASWIEDQVEKTLETRQFF